MKTLKKALFVLLALTLVLSFAACGGESTSSTGEAEPADDSVKGAPQTWGNITVFVPDTMKLSGGSMINKEDPNALSLQLKENESHYVMFSTLSDEDTAVSSVATTKEMNASSNPVDVTFTAGGVEWKGVAYKYAGMSDCFMVYANVSGTVFVVQGGWYAYDSAEVKAILGGFTYTAA